jgi:hypothetical protein
VAGYLTVCFSDWTKDSFRNGVMRIVDGRRTDDPIRRSINPAEVEGIDYYIKPDPDFRGCAYRRCHRQLRQQLEVGDILFFRTLWRNCQHLIGYFTISAKVGDTEDPVCLADPSRSLLLPGYIVPITEELVCRLNSCAVPNSTRHINAWINENLGRNYLRLSAERTAFLKALLDSAANVSNALLHDPAFEADGWSAQQAFVWQKALGLLADIFDEEKELSGLPVTVGNIFLVKALFYARFARRLVAELVEATAASEGAPSSQRMGYVRSLGEEDLRTFVFETAAYFLQAPKVPDQLFLAVLGFSSEERALQQFIPSLREEVLVAALAGELTLSDLAHRQPYVIMRLSDG